MQTVVVGGHARKIGKTSVMTRLIRGICSCGWTAVKITQHHQDLSLGRGGGSPEREDFFLTEESAATARGDTHRYLAAGARRALWMRVRPGSLGEAWPALLAAIEGDRFVMIESNSILDFIEPDVCLMVLNSRARSFKFSARRVLHRADALITMGPIETPAWPGLSAPEFRSKPVFAVSRPEYTSRELCRFVRRRLQLPALPSQAAGGA